MSFGTVHRLRTGMMPTVPTRVGASHLHPVTQGYLNLPGVGLNEAQVAALETNVRTVEGGGKVTVLNFTCDIAATDGGAFLTGPSDDVRWAAIGGYSVKLIDGAAKEATGRARRPGIAEAYSAELLTTWTNRAATPYDAAFTSVGKDITSASTTTGNSMCISDELLTVVGGLYLISVNVTLISGAIVPQIFSASTDASVFFNDLPQTQMVEGANTYRINHINDAEKAIFIWTWGGASNISAMNSMKRIVAPSQEGFWIVDANEAYSFASIQAGFDSTGGVTLEITR